MFILKATHIWSSYNATIDNWNRIWYLELGCCPKTRGSGFWTEEQTEAEGLLGGSSTVGRSWRYERSCYTLAERLQTWVLRNVDDRKYTQGIHGSAVENIENAKCSEGPSSKSLEFRFPSVKIPAWRKSFLRKAL